jgi:hypothetical protein
VPELRALTVRPPWSWAILHGKDVENRSWETKYRGPLLLHGGSRSRWDPDGECSPLVREAWAARARSRPEAHNSICLLRRTTNWMPFGAVVALVEVAGCHHAADCFGHSEASGHYGGYCSPWGQPDCWHWVLRDVRPLPDPVPARGWLGLWRPTPDTERAVMEQLEASHA